MLAYTGHDQMK